MIVEGDDVHADLVVRIFAFKLFDLIAGSIYVRLAIYANVLRGSNSLPCSVQLASRRAVVHSKREVWILKRAAIAQYSALPLPEKK